MFWKGGLPPLAISFKTTFDKWLSEPGDVVPITHSMLPDVEAGTKGLSDYYMEIINRSVDWHNNLVTMKLLGTGFDRGSYGAISPIMTITSGVLRCHIADNDYHVRKFRNLLERFGCRRC